MVVNLLLRGSLLTVRQRTRLEGVAEVFGGF